MRHAPYASEYLAVPTMSDGELLDYFLLRSYETEEVWGLQCAGEWLLRERRGEVYFAVWPYQRFAAEAAIEFWPEYTATAMSLEQFAFDQLPELIDQDIGVEVMPRAAAKGCLITSQRLLDIVEGMFEAGEYRLEG